MSSLRPGRTSNANAAHASSRRSARARRAARWLSLLACLVVPALGTAQTTSAPIGGTVPPVSQPPGRPPPVTPPPVTSPPVTQPPVTQPPVTPPPVTSPPVTPPPVTSPPTPPPTGVGTVTDVKIEKVWAWSEGEPTTGLEEPPRIKFGKTLAFRVHDLKAVVDASRAAGRRWGVMLDGVYIFSITPTQTELSATGDGDFRFFLGYTKAEHDLWSRVFGFWQQPGLSPHELRLALEDGTVQSPPYLVDLYLFERWNVAVIFAVCLGSFLVLFVYGQRKGLLQDPDENGHTARDSPYSLSRVQLAGWIWIVSSAYFFLWMAMGTFDVMTPTAFAVLGISGVTYAGAMAIDSGRRQQAREQGLSGAVLTKQRRGNRGFLGIRGFLRDLLGGDEGPSFHRLQLLGWTLALMIAFVWNCLYKLSMPTFTEVYFALLGISAGTYLGVKLPESAASFPPGNPIPVPVITTTTVPTTTVPTTNIPTPTVPTTTVPTTPTTPPTTTTNPPPTPAPPTTPAGSTTGASPGIIPPKP